MSNELFVICYICGLLQDEKQGGPSRSFIPVYQVKRNPPFVSMTEPVQLWSRIAYLSPLALDSTLCSRDLQVRLSYVLRIANLTSG